MQADQHAAGDAVSLRNAVFQVGDLLLADCSSALVVQVHVLPAGHDRLYAQHLCDLLHTQANLKIDLCLYRTVLAHRAAVHAAVPGVNNQNKASPLLQRQVFRRVDCAPLPQDRRENTEQRQQCQQVQRCPFLKSQKHVTTPSYPMPRHEKICCTSFRIGHKMV